MGPHDIWHHVNAAADERRCTLDETSLTANATVLMESQMPTGWRAASAAKKIQADDPLLPGHPHSKVLCTGLVLVTLVVGVFGGASFEFTKNVGHGIYL